MKMKMQALALASKCGCAGHRILEAGRGGGRQQAFFGKKEARATPPSPEADVARKSLRVRSRWFSIGFMAIRAILW